MLTKIKVFSIISLLALSLQTTIFAMNQEIILLDTPIHDPQRKNHYQFNLPHSFNIFVLLQKKFDSKSKSHSSIKTELLEKYKILKKKNDEGGLVSDNDAYEIQMLWDQFKALHNYDWLDNTLYPLHKAVDYEKLNKIRKKKPLCLFVHSDKYKEENRAKMDALFVYLGDSSRPAKYMDFISKPVIIFAASAAYRATLQTAAHTVATVCSLPSLLFPDFFKNAATSHYKNELKKTNQEIGEYDRAIKITKINVETKQQEARDALNIFSRKNKIYQN